MSSADEDEDLRIAIALSLETERNAAQPVKNAGSVSERGIRSLDGISSAEQSQETPFALNRLDRRKMEEERLARLAKRQQKSSSPPPTKRLKATVLDTQVSSVQAGKQDTSVLEYPAGRVKRTWCFGHERRNDVKIEEVLQKADLKIAVLSALDWDLEWLFRKIDITSTKLVLIMQAKGPGTKEQYGREAAAWKIPTLKLCFPNMSGQINCMHSKLMLLFHKDHLRIVVPTANLTKHDWGEDGIIENSVFMVDLPRLNGESASVESLTMFGRGLIDLLRAMDAPQMVIEGVLKFNFARTGHLAFLHTIGGLHYEPILHQTGFPGLGTAVKRLNLISNSTQIDFAASSIGSLDDKFLTNLYCAASDGVLPNARRDVPPQLRERIRIYFPLEETVLNSRGGKNAAGTNCLQKHHFNSPKFPKECMRNYKSKRTGLLSHNKLLFVRGQRGDKNVAWAYVGSANASESAWGQLVQDRTKKSVRLNCRNWECGVLIPIPAERMERFSFERGKLPPLRDVFEGIVDVPFEFPGEKFGLKTPWFFMDDTNEARGLAAA